MAILLYLPFPSNALAKIERCTGVVRLLDFYRWLLPKRTSVHAQERPMVDCSVPYVVSGFPKEAEKEDSLTVKLLHKFDRTRWRHVAP